jgi:hypothetical protein
LKEFQVGSKQILTTIITIAFIGNSSFAVQGGSPRSLQLSAEANSILAGSSVKDAAYLDIYRIKQESDECFAIAKELLAASPKHGHAPVLVLQKKDLSLIQKNNPNLLSFVGDPSLFKYEQSSTEVRYTLADLSVSVLSQYKNQLNSAIDQQSSAGITLLKDYYGALNERGDASQLNQERAALEKSYKALIREKRTQETLFAIGLVAWSFGILASVVAVIVTDVAVLAPVLLIGGPSMLGASWLINWAKKGISQNIKHAEKLELEIKIIKAVLKSPSPAEEPAALAP